MITASTEGGPGEWTLGEQEGQVPGGGRGRVEGTQGRGTVEKTGAGALGGGLGGGAEEGRGGREAGAL